ncbi:hypothetical protein ABBQ38_005622 [Trebouxia sp. C0009 RCD-2024]
MDTIKALYLAVFGNAVLAYARYTMLLSLVKPGAVNSSKYNQYDELPCRGKPMLRMPGWQLLFVQLMLSLVAQLQMKAVLDRLHISPSQSQCVCGGVGKRVVQQHQKLLLLQTTVIQGFGSQTPVQHVSGLNCVWRLRR